MKYLTLEQFETIMEKIAPIKNAESYDNPGMLIRTEKKEIKRVLLALDLTQAVAQEAVEMGADLVLTHHPVLFNGTKRLDFRQPEQLAIMTLIKHDISHFAAHTNWDAAENGVNATLCNILGIKNARPLDPINVGLYKLVVFVPKNNAEELRRAIAEAGAGRLGAYSHCSFSTSGEGRFMAEEGAKPAIGELGKIECVGEERIEAVVRPENLSAVLDAMRKVHPYEEIAFDLFEESGNACLDERLGILRMGELSEGMKLKDFAAFVSNKLACAGLRYTGDTEKIVKKIAVCGGAGDSLINQARAAGADAYVTSDVKYHIALEASGYGFAIIDAGHYETEKPAMQSLIDCLQASLGGVQYNTEFVLSARENAPMHGIQ